MDLLEPKPIEYTFKEYAEPVAMVDRAHHAKFLAWYALAIAHREPSIASNPHYYAKIFIKERKAKVRWNIDNIQELETIRSSFQKFNQFPWFYPLVTCLKDEAYAQYYKSAPVTSEGQYINRIYQRIIEKLLKASLLTLTEQVWGENKFHVSFRKSNRISNTEYIHCFLQEFGYDLHKLAEEDVRELIKFLMYVLSEYEYKNIFHNLCSDSKKFVETLDEMIDDSVSNLKEFEDIDTIDFRSDEFKKAEALEYQVAETFFRHYHRYPDNLIVLNINPGALCAYNKVPKIGCAPHCLDKVNIDGIAGDDNYMVLIQLFLESHPKFKPLFNIVRYRDPITGIEKVVEIAFPIRMFKEAVFRDTLIEFAERSEIHHSLMPRYPNRHSLKTAEIEA